MSQTPSSVDRAADVVQLPKLSVPILNARPKSLGASGSNLARIANIRPRTCPLRELFQRLLVGARRDVPEWVRGVEEPRTTVCLCGHFSVLEGMSSDPLLARSPIVLLDIMGPISSTLEAGV